MKRDSEIQPSPSRAGGHQVRGRLTAGAVLLAMALTALGGPALGFPIPKYIEDAVVLIEKEIRVGDKVLHIPHATGFLIHDTISDKTYIITNRHVLEGHKDLVFRFNQSTGVAERKTGTLLREDGSQLWWSHPDSAVDLAALISPGIEERALASERMKSVQDVSLGDEVYFFGFPLIEYAGEDRNYPVLRHAVVAYVAREAIFSKKSSDSMIMREGAILIDGTVLPGNSGSPLLSVPRRGETRASLIGVVSGHFDVGDQNADLGIVIPINRLIELFHSISGR